MSEFANSSAYGAFRGFNPDKTVDHRVRGENAAARVAAAREDLLEATAHLRPQLLPFIRLRALTPSTELPAHEALGNPESTVQAGTLVAAVLDQALTFADRVIPAFTKDKARVESKPADATVNVSTLDRIEDKWAARTSQHINAAEPGTASWDEFNAGLRTAHCKQEVAYTPDLIGAHKVCDWNVHDQVAGWKDVTCEVYEMVQKVSFPSSNRSYPLLVVTATSAQHPQFLIVKVPVDLSAAPGAMYATGKNVDNASLSADLKKKTTVGGYVSVERVKLEESLPGYEDEKPSTAEQKIYWEMATSNNSKAKGKDKSDIAKDVRYFIDWVVKNRELKASFGQAGPSKAK